jgi:hypothetical protein
LARQEFHFNDQRLETIRKLKNPNFLSFQNGLFISTLTGAGEILTNLENQNITTIIDQLPVSNSIFWTRCNPNIDTKKDKETGGSSEVQHDHIIVKIEIDSFLEHVQDYLADSGNKYNKLAKLIAEIKQKAQVTQVTLLLPGFKQFLK